MEHDRVGAQLQQVRDDGLGVSGNDVVKFVAEATAGQPRGVLAGAGMLPLADDARRVIAVIGHGRGVPGNNKHAVFAKLAVMGVLGLELVARVVAHHRVDAVVAHRSECRRVARIAIQALWCFLARIPSGDETRDFGGDKRARRPVFRLELEYTGRRNGCTGEAARRVYCLAFHEHGVELELAVEPRGWSLARVCRVGQ